MKEETVRLNFEFPKKEYPYLKLICAEQGVSFKEFATVMLLKAIEEYEDKMLTQKANERLKEMVKEDAISWDEACKLAGWDDEAKI